MGSDDPFRVLIAGGGVAALEAGLALRALAAERVGITLVTPQPEFFYRPASVREPFAYEAAQRHPLSDIARDIDAELVVDTLASVDAGARTARLGSGRTLPYDALVVAIGARAYPRFAHATTIDDAHLDEQLHGVVQDIEEGYVRSVAYIAPPRLPWPLPLYELALMTARRAHDMGVTVQVTLATPEQAPLAVFGEEASRAVQALLDERGIELVTGAEIEVPASNRLVLYPTGAERNVDRVIALPELAGPAIDGLPADAHGFLPVDPEGRVRGAERVYAAGDAADSPVKHGGLSSQQADAAAASIAALAGADVAPQPYEPELQGMLLTGGRPLYLVARLIGAQGFTAEVSHDPPWSPARKIVAQHLGPYLEQLEARS